MYAAMLIAKHLAHNNSLLSDSITETMNEFSRSSFFFAIRFIIISRERARARARNRILFRERA
jgi:hypothetical protein